MTTRKIALGLAATLLLAACANKNETPRLLTQNDTLSWAMGENIGLSMKEMSGSLPLNDKLVLQAIRTTLDGGTQPIDDNTLREAMTHAGGNDILDTAPTFKTVEDDGAFQLSKEEAGALAQRQYKFIQNLEAALVRIENKTYGICRVTGKLIPKERLRLVPHATTTVEGKAILEKTGKK